MFFNLIQYENLKFERVIKNNLRNFELSKVLKNQFRKKSLFLIDYRNFLIEIKRNIIIINF